MGVGDAEGVGGRAVADDLAVDLGAAGLGVLQRFEDHHAGPFAQHEAVAVAVEGPRGLGGLVVAGAQGGQQVEAGHAEGMDHGVRAAGEHHVGLAAADDLDRLADRLAAGGAGRQAVDVRPLGVEEAGQVAGRHVRLLLQLGDRVQRFQALLGELGQVERDRRRSGRPPSSR